ncbi:MAG TPA: radical SAM protein [Micromonospora sp.]
MTTSVEHRDWALARSAVRLKCELLADGVQVEGSIGTERINLTRRHLYDYAVTPAATEVPYEIVLDRLAGFGNAPVVARVRYNSNAGWVLRSRDGMNELYHADRDEHRPVEVPRVTDFRGHRILGRDLSTVVQRLGVDLIGVVPTNYCAYYSSNEKCAFCEIVETFQDQATKPGHYRKSHNLIVAASELAAAIDPTITCTTYNGGQLADYDATVRMYCRLITALRQRQATAGLNATVACMPPNTLSLIDELHDSGLNQVYFNVETTRADLLPIMAPAKYRFGLDQMYAAMTYALRSFGPGRVYTNLVYGIQSLTTTTAGSQWQASKENERALTSVTELLGRSVVPTYTVYHTSGRNLTGRIPLSADGLFEFTETYGDLVWQSNLIDRARGAVLFTIGSLPNTTYNDGWLLAELKARAAAASSHRSSPSCGVGS